MRAERHIISVGLCMCVVAVVGCGADEPTGAEPGNVLGTVPPLSPSSPLGGNVERTFAADYINLGRHGWEALGYNLDGLVSPKGATDACKALVPNSAGDGARGIDNSFGQNIVPLLDLMVAEHIGDDAAEASQNRDILSGAHTLLFQVRGLPKDGTSARNLTGQLFVGATLGTRPTFQPSEVWPVREDLLASLTPAESRTVFTDAYVRDGVFVSGAPQTIELELRLQRLPFRLKVQRAVVTWKTTGTSLSEGVVAGRVSAPDLVEETKTFLRRRYNVRCDGAGDKTIGTLANYADILLDGSVDATRACDGISFAFGFTAKEIQNPTSTKNERSPGIDEICAH